MKPFKKSFDKLLERFLYWRIGRISDRTFLFLTSIVIGVVAGLFAVLLKVMVKWTEHGLLYYFNLKNENYFFFLYPLIGIFLSWLFIKLVLQGNLQKGISNILYIISKKKSNVELYHTYSHLPTSAVTVAFGGSVGLEAPIVATGSALGSNIARKLRFGYKERTLLLACGAASGIAAVFNSPIAGVLFAFEVLLVEFTIPAFIPLLIAAASAAVVSKILYSGQIFYLITGGWVVEAIPFYILLGVLCGLVSAYYIRMNTYVEMAFHHVPPIRKIITGGLILGVLLFFLPPLYGEGYQTIEGLLAGNGKLLLVNSPFADFRMDPWFLLLFVGVIIIVKIFATAITISAGGNGGIFAPTLFAGALTGFFFVLLFRLLGIDDLNTSNFIVVGMAGILSGVIHVPLTAIFLIAEITGGYVLFVPLMIVSAMSFFIARYFEPHSVYTKSLARRGFLITSDRDQTVLSLLELSTLIERDFSTVPVDGTLSDLVKVIAKSRRNIYPVVDTEGHLEGLINLGQVKPVMFKEDLYHTLPVRSLMVKPMAIVDVNEEMRVVMTMFEKFDQPSFPVTEGGKYIGFISKSLLFDHYRSMMKKQAREFV
ncbi:MAG: chloride channel protein [Bacteroidota bacterium]